MFATYVNCLAVVVGAIVGLILKKYIKESFNEVVMTSAGLVTCIIGISMALKTGSYLVMIFSVIVGGLVGYALHIEEHVLSLGNWLQKKTDKKGDGVTFAQGFLNASLLFCTGAMSIVGSIQAGTVGDYQLIFVKSIMDGCMAIVFAAAYGPGVLFSAVTILIYQGFFTLAGGWLEPHLGENGINEMGSVGGILLLMIACNLLGIKKCKTGDFLFALFFAPFFSYVASLFA
ncbi:MAG: DUF554 domain-containing protein [Sphaerochaetaceae bacterium]|jgi:hypothetical protein